MIEMHNIYPCFYFYSPRFIILYIKRFTKNTFFVEKNPTIVNFPVKGIEFGDLLSEEVTDVLAGRINILVQFMYLIINLGIRHLCRHAYYNPNQPSKEKFIIPPICNGLN